MNERTRVPVHLSFTFAYARSRFWSFILDQSAKTWGVVDPVSLHHVIVTPTSKLVPYKLYMYNPDIYKRNTAMILSVLLVFLDLIFVISCYLTTFQFPFLILFFFYYMTFLITQKLKVHVCHKHLHNIDVLRISSKFMCWYLTLSTLYVVLSMCSIVPNKSRNRTLVCKVVYWNWYWIDDWLDL